MRVAWRAVEAGAAAGALLGAALDGGPVGRVYGEERLGVARELYLAVMIDRDACCHTLLASPEGIATNILADRLKRLEDRGLVKKVRDARDSRQFIYSPTELAISLVPMLLELIVWSAKTGDVSVDKRVLRDFRLDREACVGRLQEEARKNSKHI